MPPSRCPAHLRCAARCGMMVLSAAGAHRFRRAANPAKKEAEDSAPQSIQYQIQTERIHSPASFGKHKTSTGIVSYPPLWEKRQVLQFALFFPKEFIKTCKRQKFRKVWYLHIKYGKCIKAPSEKTRTALSLLPFYSMDIYLKNIFKLCSPPLPSYSFSSVHLQKICR